jgi:HK97 family phage major capsid protein
MRKKYRDAILAEVKAARAIADAAIAAERELSDVERSTIDGHMEKAAAFAANAEKEEALNAQMDSLTQGVGLNTDGPDNVEDRSDSKAANRPLSVGKAFSASAEYKALLAKVPNGTFSEKMRVHSDPMQLPGMKALFYSGDREASAGFLVEDDKRGLLDPFYKRPLTIRSLMTAGSTTSDTIDYLRMVSVDNNAAVVPEARKTGVIGSGSPAITAAEGGLKPESGFEFERDSTTVKTLAHWIPITKRALSDAAQVRTMIDSFLRYGLEEAFEDELVTGNGTGEHLLGLNSTPGIQTQAAPTGTQDNFDILRMARRKVAIGGRARPTAYVMNPIDREKIDLMRDDNGVFFGGGPFSLTDPPIWGLPVVESEAIAVGTAWCAAWNYGVIYDREQASVQATDSHADYFVRNLVAILAEMRAGFAILRPSAFVKITLG